MRGDVVLLDFPFAEGGQAKVRPALIVRSDAVVTHHTIVAQITGIRLRTGPTRLLVDPATESGSGLLIPSLIVCEQLYTVRQDRILRTIGALSAATMADVDVCLKTALGLS